MSRSSETLNYFPREGRGSRVRFLLNGVEAVFHHPHPRPDTNKGAREFLKMAGIEP